MRHQRLLALHRTLPFLCCLLLALFVTGCGNAVVTTQKNSAAKLNSLSSPRKALQTYNGPDFTIDYPQNWLMQPGINRVEFSDSLDISHLVVQYTANPQGTVSTTQMLQKALVAFQSRATHYQLLTNSTATIGGENWSQAIATGDITSKAQTITMKLVVATDNHPANTPATMNLLIYYTSNIQLFPLVDSSIFQPMLLSFQFQ